jgi:hypothetical protein
MVVILTRPSLILDLADPGSWPLTDAEHASDAECMSAACRGVA